MRSELFTIHGLCYEAFRQELLEQASRKLGTHHEGSGRQEIAEARAERVVTKELPGASGKESRQSASTQN
jgi:hypothetical protein